MFQEAVFILPLTAKNILEVASGDVCLFQLATFCNTLLQTQADPRTGIISNITHLQKRTNCRGVPLKWWVSEGIQYIYWDLHRGLAQCDSGLKLSFHWCRCWQSSHCFCRTLHPVCIISAGDPQRHLLRVARFYSQNACLSCVHDKPIPEWLVSYIVLYDV